MPSFRSVLCGVITLLLVTASLTAAAATPNRELIVCGWDEVYILDLNRRPVQKVWNWKASHSPGLPGSMRTKFRTTDECKSLDGGRRILITASSDGVALVDRATGKTLFYASVGGAHSAEMLPGGPHRSRRIHKQEPLGEPAGVVRQQAPGRAAV